MAGEVTRGEWSVRAPGGPCLAGRSWIPCGRARAAVLVVHGLGEHTGRYEATALALAAAGFAVHAVDYRGHGLSKGRRVHVDDVDDYVSDVRAALVEVHRFHEPGASRRPTPVFLLGHSQGGLVALKLALDHPAAVDGIVVTSPLLAVHPRSRPSAPLRAAAVVLRFLAPGLPVPTRIDVGTLSRDPSVGEAYARDPLVSHAASAGWLRAVTRAQREVLERAATLRPPTLILAGGADELTDPEAARRFAAAAPADRVTFEWWDGYYHELLNDVGKEKVLERIGKWICEQSR